MLMLKLVCVCWMLINGALLVRSARINQSLLTDPQIIDSASLETGIDAEQALEKWRDLKAKLLKLKPESVSDDGGEEDATHDRQIRTLFPAGYNGCSCSDLAAIAAQITFFEEEVNSIDDLENQMNLIATAVKQLGRWIGSGVRGPQGAEGPQGSPGVTGLQGDAGDTGSDTSMNREGVPGPQGASGSTGTRGIKGKPGDCIQGQKGLQGKKGEPGVGSPGRRGPTGPVGLPGSPAPILASQKKS